MTLGELSQVNHIKAWLRVAFSNRSYIACYHWFDIADRSNLLEYIEL